jgi:hypothetical protein
MTRVQIQGTAMFVGSISASMFDFLLSTLLNSEPGRPFIIGFLSAGFAIGVLKWLNERLGVDSSNVEKKDEDKANKP